MARGVKKTLGAHGKGRAEPGHAVAPKCQICEEKEMKRLVVLCLHNGGMPLLVMRPHFAM